MSYRLRYTKQAGEDLIRLFRFQAERDVGIAERALAAIAKSLELLRDHPFACRKAAPGNPVLRELIISFGASGYVALFEIVDDSNVLVLAVRHQLEEDYH